VLDLEQYRIGGRTAREIAASAEAAIRNGRLETGTRLPTVRALADELGTSPATVNAAYRLLRQRGLVVAEGRRGTRVAPRPALRTPLRHAPLPDAERNGHLRDLAIGLPDPALLPDLGRAIAAVDVRRSRIDALGSADPALLEAARAEFAADGVDPERIAIVGGAFDGIERTLSAHLRPGDRVIVEDPTYPAIRDLLLALGLVEVPVAVDDYGPVPAAFAAALRRGADASVLVPRAQNPRGAALDDARAVELRAELERHPDVLLIEDDHAAGAAGSPFVSLIDASRARWAVIRSTSKVLHPDLRLALMAGDETTVARVEGRQGVGTRWVSHLLQAVVADLMAAPEFAKVVVRARETYASRRAELIDALAEHGVHGYGRTGLNVWVPVREEAPAVRALANAGWLVASGERFRIATPPGLRITIATLRPGEAHEIARVVASVEHAGRLRDAY
jgi:DNA-binding transcriptional MocR family regulator